MKTIIEASVDVDLRAFVVEESWIVPRNFTLKAGETLEIWQLIKLAPSGSELSAGDHRSGTIRGSNGAALIRMWSEQESEPSTIPTGVDPDSLFDAEKWWRETNSPPLKREAHPALATGLVLLPLKGEIDLHEAPAVKAKLSRLLTENAEVGVIVDMSDVSYIDASGLALFIEMMQRLGSRDLPFALCSLRQSVRRIFEISRLEQVFYMYATRAEAAKAVGENDAPISNAERHITTHFEAVSKEAFAYFSKHPDLLYELHPRKFEELIAELFKAMGCDVELTPYSGDGGRDILASFSMPWGRMLTYVEVKRWAKEYKIGPNVVRSFMYVVDSNKVSGGVLVTTSSFTSGARDIEAQQKHRLSLRDIDALTEWMSCYGNWNRDPAGGLWVPR